jgi:hypothetical protein
VVGRWRGASRTSWLLVKDFMVLLYLVLALWNVDVIDIFAALKSLYLDTTLLPSCRETGEPISFQLEHV